MPLDIAPLRNTPQVLHFGTYDVDLRSGELRNRGIRIRLRQQSLQVLAALLQRPGEVISREELRQALWPDGVFVNFESNLNAVVAHLREVLGDTAERPRYIETLPRHGYRFIGDASALPAAANGAASAPRLVVLPFVNLSGDASQEYFSDAMTDEIITAIANVAPEHLAVIARTTAMRYKRTRKQVGRIGRELSVDYVVEGAVHRAGNEVAINVQLIRARDQVHLFAGRYGAKNGEIFEMHSAVARDIAAHVAGPGVADEMQRSAAPKKPTADARAYNAYIQGRYLAERLTPEAMTAAKAHFEEAIARDPRFALAHTAIADLYSWVGYTGTMRPRDAYALGFPFAARAAQMDDGLAEAHAVLAEYHKQVDYDWGAAEQQMRRALALSRASPFVRLRHAVVVLMPQNRIAEAAAEIECALRSDPLAGATRTWLGILLLLAQQYDRAIDEARDLRELEPMSPWPHFIIGVAYRQKHVEGRARGAPAADCAAFANQAIASHRQAIELSPGSDFFLGWLGLALGVCGRKADARAVLKRLQRSEHYVLPTSFGHVHLGLGEFDAAMEWFERAVEERDQIMMPILSYAHFDPIRQHPRFEALLRTMRLAGAN